MTKLLNVRAGDQRKEGVVVSLGACLDCVANEITDQAMQFSKFSQASRRNILSV